MSSRPAPERGVYFDAWFPGQHCYHPSLPPRRLRQVEDLRDLRATVLVWSALGGGSISLPYLEQEAFGEIDARFRMYGFVNDSEFIRAAQAHGIKVFGIVFEVQGWEFPAELSDDGRRVLALNELRGDGRRTWIGLREFSQDALPGLWPPIERYFPDGLVNSDGEPVTDLLEECCSRAIDGTPHHARWVECPDREHVCYLMDRNNPVWREYLKAVIRIQIDAGVDGVQLDEAETPMTALQYGGCFCKDCTKGFREHLRRLPADRRPAELGGVDVEAFDYGAWLRDQGFDGLDPGTPLFGDYMAFQRRAIAQTFSELAAYAREYAAARGRSVLVSGNFFNLFEHYYPLEQDVDLVITEMRNTTYRQPAWYRYVAGFAPDKPTVVVENPYGGVVPELVEMLKHGRGYDLFRMSLYEGAALGVNMSVPYGAWMGSVIEDSWHPPRDLCVEIQTFLAENEALLSRTSLADTAVVFSVESSYRAEARTVISDNRENPMGEERPPFWAAAEALADARQPFDVVFFPDGDLRADTITAADLARYRTVVLPGCVYLTEAQAAAVLGYLDAGGRVAVAGPVAENLPEATRERIRSHAGAVAAAVDDAGGLAGEPQAHVDGDADLALLVHDVEDGAALHVIRYAYDADADRVPPLPHVRVSLRLPRRYAAAEARSPDGRLTATLAHEGDRHVLDLGDTGVYGIVHLREG